MELPEYYDVGPISLLSGTLFERERYIYRRKSSVVRAPDSWLKGGRFESLQEWQENYLLQDQPFCADSYFGICSTPVLLQYHIKDPGHAAKSAGGRLQLKTHAPYIYVVLHKWHVAWLHGVHRTRQDSNFMWHQSWQCYKYTTSVDIPKMQHKKLVSHVESHVSTVSLLESGK